MRFPLNGLVGFTVARRRFWSARRLACGLAALFAAGCSTVGTHPLKLGSEVISRCDPGKGPDCRPVYVSCEQLDLLELTFHIGIFDQEQTTVACPPELSDGPATVEVRYRVGEPFYMIDTNWLRDGLSQNASAGPFSENDPDWKMLLR